MLNVPAIEHKACDSGIKHHQDNTSTSSLTNTEMKMTKNKKKLDNNEQNAGLQPQELVNTVFNFYNAYVRVWN